MSKIRHLFSTYFSGSIVGAFFIFFVAIYLSAFLVVRLQDLIYQQQMLQFHQRATDKEYLIANRLQTYKGLLYSARSLIYTFPLTSDSWHEFVANLNIFKEYPGVALMGYSAYIQDSNKAAFMQHVRQMGVKNFSITPIGTRNIYVVGLFIDPQNATTQSAIGADSYFYPQRQSAITEAINSAEPVLSDKVNLFVDSKLTSLPGFTMRLGVFNPTLPQNTLQQRLASVIGFVNISFRMNEFLSSIEGLHDSSVQFAVYDGLSTNNNSLYYQSFAKPPRGDRYKTTFYAYNHPWTFVFYNTTQPTLRDRFAPVTIFAVGSIFSLVIFITLISLSTRKKRLLTVVEKMTKELRESEEKYRLIYETLQDVYYQADTVGIITMITPSIFNYTGYTQGEVVGKPAKDFYHDPSDRGLFVEKLAQEGKVFDYEIQLVGKSGERVDVSVTAQVIFDKNGKSAGIAGVLRNITRRKKAERELAILVQKLKDDKKKLEEAMTKDEFLSMAAHQLRTPLGILRWRMESLLGGHEGKISPKIKEAIAKDYMNTIHLIKLVNELLDVSRINQNKIKQVPEKLHIEKIITNVLESCKEKMRAKGIRLVLHVSKEKLPEIFYDPLLLEEVITNLISNAISYNKTKGEITISVRSKEKNIELSVEDTGIGITNTDKKTIFEKFKRGSNVPKGIEGTGLGLFVVKSYIERWKGNIELESTLHKGTKITIVLPIKST